MSEKHLRQLGFTYSACGSFTKNKERTKKKKKKQLIQDVFIETKQMRIVFNTIWILEVLKIYLEEQLLIKYHVIKHSILLKIQNIREIIADLLQWFTNFLIKTLQVVILKVKLSKTKNHLKNYTNQLLEHLIKEECTHL